MKLQICALGIAMLMAVGVSAQQRGNGDIGSHALISSEKIVDLYEQKKLSWEDTVEIAKTGASFTVRGGYAEDLLLGAPVAKAKQSAQATAERACREAGAERVILEKFSNKVTGRQTGGGAMFAKIDLSARCLFQ